jgi:hypothetical protein
VGRFSSRIAATSACNQSCPIGRWSGAATGLSSAAKCNGCIVGRWWNRTGLSAYLHCSECAMGRFSSRIAATSA